MAQFRATIRGSKGEASRLGGKSTGIVANVYGWHAGIRVEARFNSKTQEDEFMVYTTGGSTGATSEKLLAYTQDGRLMIVKEVA